MSRTALKIVFMGSSDFAVPSLDMLCRAGADIAFVVTRSDRVRARGGKVMATPVGQYAEENGLRLLKPEKLKDNDEFAGILAAAAPDLIVVVAYGKILPKSLLELPPLGCVNVHASLLPEYRGAAPVQRAILDGKRETGVTLIYMSEGLDQGDIIATVAAETGGMNAGELTGVLARAGAGLLADALPAIAGGNAPRIPQDETKATYAEKVEKADGHIDLGGSAAEAVQRVRAMTPVPGAYVLQGVERIVITGALAAGTTEGVGFAAPGTILDVSKSGICVSTGDGVLIIESLKMPGRKAMPVAEYLKGNAFDAGTPLE